jgi:uncharacterized protein YlxP (DUF503 family)
MAMTVGILRFELHLPGCRGLKEKRKVVKAMIDRIHARFRVSVAETGYHDLHQRSEIGVAVVTRGTQELERLIEAIRQIAESNPEAMLTRWEPEILEAEG